MCVCVVLQVFRSFANQQYGHALVFHDYQVRLRPCRRRAAVVLPAWQ